MAVTVAAGIRNASKGVVDHSRVFGAGPDLKGVK